MWDKNKNTEGAIDNVRSMVVDRLVKARMDVANEGIAEKKRKEQEALTKAINRKNALSSLNRGGGKGGGGEDKKKQRYTEPRLEDGKYYVYALDSRGNQYGERIFDKETTEKMTTPPPPPPTTPPGEATPPPKEKDKGFIQSFNEWAFGTGKK
jgi:hypothetical protein